MTKILAIAALCVVPLAAAAPRQEGDAQIELRKMQFKMIALRNAQFKMPLESKTVRGAPYSADVFVESLQALPDGNQIVRRTTGRIYRDAKGRVRREEHAKGGPPAVSITDPAAGYAYTLDALARVAHRSTLGGTASAKAFAKSTEEKLTKMREPEEEVEYSKAGKQAKFEEGVFGAKGVETRTEALGPTPMEGVVVEGYRTTTVIPAGEVGNKQAITIVSEEWYSPDLQVLVMTRHRDPRTGESTYRLRNIVRAEPPRTLFDVPSGYTVKDTGRWIP
jgi:hypothetical protein